VIQFRQVYEVLKRHSFFGYVDPEMLTDRRHVSMYVTRAKEILRVVLEVKVCFGLREAVAALRSDEQDRTLQASEHRQAEVQQDVRVGVEAVLAVLSSEVQD